MVFGVFDGLHPGHRHFLREASLQCKELVVVVARDAVVERLKQKTPRRALTERMEEIRAFDERFIVVPGDDTEGTWSVLEAHRPDAVFVGHDQEALTRALAKLIPTIHISHS